MSKHHKDKKTTKSSKHDKPRKWVKVDGKWKRAASLDPKTLKREKKERTLKPTKSAKKVKSTKKIKKTSGGTKLSAANFAREIATRAELEPKQAKAALAALTEICYEQLTSKVGEVRIPGLVKIKVRKVPERPAGKYNVFGTMKKLPRRPGFKRLKALVLKAAKDEVVG